MQAFLGLRNHSREFIRNLGTLTKPLYALTAPGKPQSTKINWTEELRESYSQVKTAFANLRVLNQIDPTEPLHINTDASTLGYGAMLYQVIKGEIKIISYMSGGFNAVQRRWPTIEQEGFAIFSGIKHWRHLLTQNFHLHCDHRNLTYILKEPSSKLQRWSLFLQEFCFEAHHIPGADNVEADILSRLTLDRGGSVSAIPHVTDSVTDQGSLHSSTSNCSLPRFPDTTVLMEALDEEESE
jgi:hypothetical protein